MSNKKGINSFLEFIIAVIIVIPVLFVVLVLFVYGTGSINAIVQSPQSYVTQTAAALTSGESVVVGSIAPSLESTQFLGQFYGSTSCISLLDQLSRTGKLSAPNNPATLSNRYFICIGSYNSKDVTSSSWSYLPAASYNASFPSWFVASQELNSKSSINSSGINGSQGTLSFFVNVPPDQALGSSCSSFLNASTTYGYSEPSAYISALDCVPIPQKGNTSVFISVKYPGCANGCASNPVAFLHGSPGAISLQSCTYSNGNSLICQFDIG